MKMIRNATQTDRKGIWKIHVNLKDRKVEIRMPT